MPIEIRNFIIAAAGIVLIGVIAIVVLISTRGPSPQQETNVTAQAPQSATGQPGAGPGTSTQPGTTGQTQQPPAAQQPSTGGTTQTPQAQPPAASNQAPAKPAPQHQTQAPKPAPKAKPSTPSGGGAKGESLADMVAKDMPSMVDFGATWCPACKQMKPIVDSIQKEYSGRVKVIYIDVDKNRQLAADSNVSSIPTQIYFDSNGKEVARHVGVDSVDNVRDRLDKLGVSR